MTTSNLTPNEKAVYDVMELPYCYKTSYICRKLGKSQPWVSYIIKRLIEMGHVRKVDNMYFAYIRTEEKTDEKSRNIS